MKTRNGTKVSVDGKDTKTKSDSIYRNPHHVESVNVAMGPRVGNKGLDGKRAKFLDAKASREPLAESILNAYGERQREDYSEHEFPNDGSIDENSHVKRFEARKSKFTK
jgi:hypothetical protein